MSVRINKARNFKGKAYVAADELDSLIETMTFATALTGSSNNGWKVNFKYADQDGNETKTAVDLTAIKEYIDNKSITVTGGAGITINSSNALNPTIAADIDSATILFSDATTGAKLKTGLKIVKKTTANTGFAASYQLCDNAGTAITGSADINIFKDQFLKDAVFGWANGNDSSASGFAFKTTKDSTHTVPTLRFDVYTYNQNTGDDSSSDADALYKSVYIDCTTFYNDYVGSSGVNITNNVVKGVVDGSTEKIATANNTSAAVLSVGASGFKTANVQAAINYAVKNEHEKASAAVSTISDKVVALGGTVSAAVVSLDTAISTVAGNAQTAITNASANLTTKITGVATNANTAITSVATAIGNVESKVNVAIADVNSNVESAIDSAITNVNNAISANISKVNYNVSAAVNTVNTKVDTAVGNVNTNVGALAESVSGSINNVNSAVSAFKNTVSNTIGTLDTAIANTVTNVNGAITARNTQLTSVVALYDSAVNPTYNSTVSQHVATVQAKYIIGVYEDNVQVYPEIELVSAGSFKLSADYGNTSATPAWNVICAQDIPAYTSTVAKGAGYSNTVAFTSGTNAVAYSDAEDADDASYSNVTKTDAATVDAKDVSYTSTVDASDVTVADGTAGTASTTVAKASTVAGTAAPAATTKSAPDYYLYS